MDCFIILTCSRKSRSKFLWPVDSSLRDWAAMPIFFFYPSLFTQSDWKLSESIIPITHTWAEPTWMQIHLAFTHPIKFAFWALWLACFLQAQSNGVYYFVSPAWPVASSVRQGKKEGLVKATVRSRAPAQVPPGLRLCMCVLGRCCSMSLQLLGGWWGSARQLSLPKDPVVHTGRKFYLPKWLATGKVSTSSSEVFLTHISSWEFLVLTKVQYAACLICCFIYQGKETTVWGRSIYSKSYFRLKVDMLVLVVCCLNL